MKFLPTKKGTPDFNRSVDSTLAAHCERCMVDTCPCRKISWNLASWRKASKLGHAGFQKALVQILDGRKSDVITTTLTAMSKFHNTPWFTYEVLDDNVLRAGCAVCQAVSGNGLFMATKHSCQMSHVKRHGDLMSICRGMPPGSLR